MDGKWLIVSCSQFVFSRDADLFLVHEINFAILLMGMGIVCSFLSLNFYHALLVLPIWYWRIVKRSLRLHVFCLAYTPLPVLSTRCKAHALNRSMLFSDHTTLMSTWPSGLKMQASLSFSGPLTPITVTKIRRKSYDRDQKLKVVSFQFLIKKTICTKHASILKWILKWWYVGWRTRRKLKRANVDHSQFDVTIICLGYFLPVRIFLLIQKSEIY